MRERPFYVALICCYLIIVNSWYLVHSFTTIDSPEMQARMHDIPLPILVQEVQFFLSMVIPLLTAMFMSEGANWARVVYIGWGIANFLLLALVLPSTYDFQPGGLLLTLALANNYDLQPGVCILAVFAILLLIPRSRGYFLLERHHS